MAGKAKLTDSPVLAYGKKGKKFNIPGCAVLVFEIELLGIESNVAESEQDRSSRYSKWIRRSALRVQRVLRPQRLVDSGCLRQRNCLNARQCGQSSYALKSIVAVDVHIASHLCQRI